MADINNTKVVVPSLPAGSYEELETLFSALTGVAREVQVDIVDGTFVPFVSWPFTESDIKAAFQKLAAHASAFELEIDCMIMRPERFLDLFVEIGAKRVVIHLRSTDAYSEIIQHAKTNGYKIGLATINDVPLSELEEYIEQVDFVQLMGIKEIGQQGQPFDERTLGRVSQLRAQYPSLEIAVDGSVNNETIRPLLEVGVNRFAPGSAVAKAQDPAVAFRTLSSLIS